MRLEELMEKETPDGTYAGVHFDAATIKALQTFIKENNIPNKVAGKKMHTTLLYSRKYLPDFKPQGKIDPPYVGKPTSLDVWESQPDEDGNTSNCLVLEFDCPDLNRRHKDLMKEHDATYDYDEYKTHVTLSYDIGDMKIDDISDPKETIKEIVIVDEYKEDLDLNWAKNKSKSE